MPDSQSRESTDSNRLCNCFEVRAFSFSPQCPSSFSRINEYLALLCINEYLALDSGGNVSEQSSCIINCCTAISIHKLQLGSSKVLL